MMCDLDQLLPFAIYESFDYLVGLDVTFTSGYLNNVFNVSNSLRPTLATNH